MKKVLSFYIKLLLCIGLLFSKLSYADDLAATIIQQTGTNEWRQGLGKAWLTTEINQALAQGNHVQTGQQSKMALLFRDESQLRLNQNSLLIVRSVLDDQGKSTRFRLNQGRAWVKSKNIPDKLLMETPTAVAAIRGTDWDIEVAEDGTSRITVLHGSIHFYNELGDVIVNANEQALAEPGKAPIKVVIANPKDRVQWVTEYQLNPLAFREIAGSNSSAAVNLLSNFSSDKLTGYQAKIEQLPISPFKIALLADIYLYQGKMQAAIEVIESYDSFDKIPQLKVLVGKAQLMKGVAKRITNQENHIDIDLFNAEVERFNGNARAAISLYEKVLQQDSENQQAWFALGQIYTEKEHISLALAALNKAITLNPDDAKAHSEKATLLTFVNEFSDATQSLDSADNLAASKALTLTGRGILALKQGALLKAKHYFLQAGVLEPQLSIIQTFLAITYYQLDQVELAKKTLQYATEVDENDPLPYFMLSNIEREYYNPKLALNASKQAITRLPYLKSLRQLANNLAGNANLGAALADYGLEDWATKYAVDSYDPFWAGSQLFLSHRLDDDRYAQQSELFKGILNDPLVFGASNQRSELVPQPGVYGNLRWQRVKTTRSDDEITLDLPTVTLNGMNNSIVPFSFFFEGVNNKQSIEDNSAEAMGVVDTSPKFTRVGLGSRLTPKLSVFTYHNVGGGTSGNQTETNVNGSTTTVNVATKNDLKDRYYGLQYQLSPYNDIGISHFDIEDINKQNSTLQADFSFEDPASGYAFSTNTRSDILATQDKSITSTQINWRIKNQSQHFFDIGFSQDKNDSHFILDNNQTLLTRVSGLQAGIDDTEVVTESNTFSATFDRKTIKQTYLHWQSNIHSPWYSDVLVNYHEIEALNEQSNRYGEQSENVEKLTYKDSSFSYGAGVKYAFNKHLVIRASYQDWVNSGAVVTSGTTMLAGIPFSSQYSVVGSDIQRTALQLEYEGHSIFTKFFFEQQTIDNTKFPQSFINNTTDLLSDNLRQLSAINQDVSNIYQPESYFYGDPKYSINKGTVKNYQMVVNGYLTDRLSGNISYRYSDLSQRSEKGIDLDSHAFAFHPRQVFNFGLHYSTEFSATPFIRGSYYKYPAIEAELEDGWHWNFGWRQEFFNKRAFLSVQRVIFNTDDSKVWNITGEIRF